MNKLDLELGKLIREKRQAADMTQLELATKLGYENMQFVSLFERGLSKVPMKVVGKLVNIIGLPEKKVTKMIVDFQVNEMMTEISAGKKLVDESAKSGVQAQ